MTVAEAHPDPLSPPCPKCMMDSTAMKCVLANWFRYKRQFQCVAIEHQGMDVCVANETWMMQEIEVKVSISDLRADIKKRKHYWYREAAKLPPLPLLSHTFHELSIRPPYIASKFSFAVPEGIIELATGIITEQFPYAGIIRVNDHRPGRPNYLIDVATVRKARKIHAEPLPETSRVYLLKSMSASLCRTLDRLEEFRLRKEAA